MSVDTDPVASVIADRQPAYGDPFRSHVNIGMAWGAILNNSRWQSGDGCVPPETVALMMAALKIVRAATPGAVQTDTFLDAHAYLRFAEEFPR